MTKDIDSKITIHSNASVEKSKYKKMPKLLGRCEFLPNQGFFSTCPRRPLTWRTELAIILEALVAIGSVPMLPMLLIYLFWKASKKSPVSNLRVGIWW